MKIKYLKTFMKLVFASAFIFAGVTHFTKPSFFLSMMPEYLPYHLELVYISGVVEIILGITLCIPKYSRFAAYGIIGLLIAVFPANLNMYLNAELFPDVSKTALLVRLPIQFFLIYWAYLYTKKNQKI